MIENRSLLFHGLRLSLRRFPAFLWAFLFNLVCSALTTAHIAGAIGKATDTSLAAHPLRHGFDLGTIGLLSLKLAEGPGISPSPSVSLLLYFATYFLLVPGTLLCYQTGAPARLSTLFQAGLLHFWRFVRITLLTGIVMAAVLGPLFILYTKFSAYINETTVGRSGFFYELAALAILALVAAVLRLYFDLVEVYTVQLGLQVRPNGKPDRRVRKTLIPAFRSLRRNFGHASMTFLFLTALGILAIALTGRMALHSLAQPRVWPMFLLAQTGLFLLLFTRFWQRGAETTLSLDFPIVEAPVVRPTFAPREPAPREPAPAPSTTATAGHTISPDPIPQPEPSTPSLAEPDPGIYHPGPLRHNDEADPPSTLTRL